MGRAWLPQFLLPDSSYSAFKEKNHDPRWGNENTQSRETVQFSSVAQSCPTLCDPMDCSTPGLPVHYQLPEFIQTHVHWVSDAIQPSHPLSSPSHPAFNLSQHQGLFQRVSSKTSSYENQVWHRSWYYQTRNLKSLWSNMLKVLTEK